MNPWEHVTPLDTQISYVQPPAQPSFTTMPQPSVQPTQTSTPWSGVAGNTPQPQAYPTFQAKYATPPAPPQQEQGGQSPWSNVATPSQQAPGLNPWDIGGQYPSPHSQNY